MSDIKYKSEIKRILASGITLDKAVELMVKYKHERDEAVEVNEQLMVYFLITSCRGGK